ncbi:MAG: ATP-binding cassette domain-containing protein [Candidatus Latescibacteria bacterium]|nr:ATP-binding cassette domain-containing protein [Candidatus Latescibacterota bacterium]NIM22408.1 ATP-binding cassette domain-containing protein [Candidatus Latescibacterota bacterium]NIM64768.1 ATP-binding cassette domain-containing protein [Candidatus Latescibacterota bacterium]NIO01279.1 ATP-binding cassette domain-containing protein [Candidatus Latescibacterota bacterium]NIO27771.1 ATP-binding cassette domain-containing protein [Candidatus Latescibacterota bacterium]
MIEISDLTRYYGDLRALDHISLSIKRGEILGLLGPNGAGKTTLLRILTGYLAPTSGAVTAMGFSIDEKPLEIKKFIGYLPEEAPLYKDMLVYDYLNYVAAVRGITRERKTRRIRELTDICGLSEIMHRSIHELSKGYKQRVGLAHAMMSDPEILILDEPTSGLDPNQIVEIRDIIKVIGKEKTVILSTHILSEVEATCDRVVIINKGRIVADGSTAELKQSSELEYALNITLKGAEGQDVKTLLSPVEGIKEVRELGATNGELAFRLVCDTAKDIRDEVYGKIKQRDWILLEFTQEYKSLEKIFRELTKES